ncbi:hypothetical protein RvY_05788-2 [Ramazzottius varieornatus]|uniref:Uncharacterized protein n=1 Tax=Ramazzottius varieornatus TaxID=947166 RepID=A0A1D1V5Y2_RAMVA|nr:hypothetical protein RvY_05788-2 [Ramazzottius varieornatus]
MATLNLDSRKLDLIARLPFAFALDYLIGTAWRHVPWPTLPEFDPMHSSSSVNSTRTSSPEEMGLVISGVLRAASWRCLMAIGAVLCWMVVRFFPSTQIILVAIWVETVCMLPATIALTTATLELPMHYAVLAMIGCHLACWNMLNNLRQLRLLELMSLPPAQAEHYAGMNVRQIGNNCWMYLWPKISLIVLVYRYFHPPSEAFVNMVKFVTYIASLSAFALVLAGLQWRAWNTVYVLRGRSNGEIRLSVISNNYYNVDNFMWVSVNEEMINKAYALVFLGHWANSIAPVVYHHGIQAVVAAAPEAFVQSATTSWISLFGLCWVLACLYHKVMTLWFRSMQIGFTAAQERDHAALKFELSGCFYLFLWLGDVLDMDRQLTVIHVSRMMFFFVLFKLATIPSVSGQVAQTQALEGSGSGLNYSKYVVEGSIVPAALGIFLLDRSISSV